LPTNARNLNATQTKSRESYNPFDFMADGKTLDEHYKAHTDQELLKLRAEGGFTAEAEQVLDKELARRNISAIPIPEIASFEPQPHLPRQWPYSDPCRDRTFSPPRFILMSTIFLCLIVGSVPLFLLLTSKPYGLQEASIISYTLFELFFTFARTGTKGGPDLPPFKFKCPAVRPQIPRLLWRHAGFLVALFALQTAMLAARTYLPEWWNMKDRKGATSFDLVLMLMCLGLGYAQVFTNRSLLDRAHREFAA
jgi:hypothetical protein